MAPSSSSDAALTLALENQTRFLLAELDKRFESIYSKWEARVGALESQVTASERHLSTFSSSLRANVEAHLMESDAPLDAVQKVTIAQLRSSTSSSLGSVRESDLAYPEQLAVDAAASMCTTTDAAYVADTSLELAVPPLLNPLVHVDFGAVTAADSTDRRHQVDPAIPFAPHLRGLQAVLPLLRVAFGDRAISAQLTGARGRLDNLTTTLMGPNFDPAATPAHLRELSVELSISSPTSSLLQLVVPREEDEISSTLPNRCLMNCFILIQSCFSPPFSCSWDAVPHRQPWPPPVQFVILGEGVQSCLSPWPSFSGATTGFKCNVCTSLMLFDSSAASASDRVTSLKNCRRARGLCDRCAEKWVYGHKCPSTVQLQAIEEVWNMLNEDEVSEPVVKYSEQLMLALSAAAWTGANTATTLRLWGTVQQHKIPILRRGFLWRIGSEEGALELNGHDPYTSADRARAIGVELVSMEEAMTTPDFISLHMPLTPATNKMLNDEAFAKMKKGVRIINVARGGVIDEDALVRALDLGLVAQAALDVFTKEPPTPDNKLGLHENVTVTPHLGASTVEAQEGVAIEIAEAVVGALKGELAASTVNAPMGPAEVLSELAPFVVLAEKLGRLAVQLVAGGTVQDLGTHAASLMASGSWMCSDSAST